MKIDDIKEGQLFYQVGRELDGVCLRLPDWVRDESGYHIHSVDLATGTPQDFDGIDQGYELRLVEGWENIVKMMNDKLKEKYQWTR